MNGDERRICDDIFSTIQDDIRDLCDPEIFSKASFV